MLLLGLASSCGTGCLLKPTTPLIPQFHPGLCLWCGSSLNLSATLNVLTLFLPLAPTSSIDTAGGLLRSDRLGGTRRRGGREKYISNIARWPYQFGSLLKSKSNGIEVARSGSLRVGSKRRMNFFRKASENQSNSAQQLGTSDPIQERQALPAGIPSWHDRYPKEIGKGTNLPLPGSEINKAKQPKINCRVNHNSKEKTGCQWSACPDLDLAFNISISWAAPRGKDTELSWSRGGIN